MIRLLTPCATRNDITEEYNFIPMPYQDDDGQIKKIDMPIIRSGVKIHGEGDNTTWDLSPITCEIDHGENSLYPCQEVVKRSTNAVAIGGEQNIVVRAAEKTMHSKLQIEDLPRNEYLIYSLKTIKILSVCPGQAEKRLSGKGLMILRLGFKCTAQIPGYEKTLTFQPREEIRLNPNRKGIQMTTGNEFIQPRGGQLEPPLSTFMWNSWEEGGAVTIIVFAITGTVALGAIAFLLTITSRWALVDIPRRRRRTPYVTTSRA
jgi:hypothetical protein